MNPLNYPCSVCKAKRGDGCTTPGTKHLIRGWHAERGVSQERNRKLDAALKRLTRAQYEEIRHTMFDFIQMIREDDIDSMEGVINFLDKAFRKIKK